MCLNPRSIRNPTNYFTSGVDKPRLMVPCGHCSECVNAQRMEWQSRLYYEHLGAQSTGFTLFFTLTYAPGKVPKLYLKESKQYYKDSKGRVVYCFDESHIPAFMKRIRRSIDYDNLPIDIRFFVCSEYGDSPDDSYIDDSGHRREFSHRPHYHGLFFVRSTDGSKLDIEKTSEYLRALIAEKWSYGRKTFTFGGDCMYSLPAGVVSAAGPIGYCAKYLNKDLASDSYYQECLKDLETRLNSDAIKEIRKKIQPRHYQSQGLGRCCLDMLSPETLDTGLIPVPVYDSQSGIVVTKQLRMPQYLMRKVNYYLDKERGKWFPTERGKRNLTMQLLNERNDTIEVIRNFRMVFNSNFVKDSVFTEQLLKYAKNYFPKLQNYEDILSLYNSGSQFTPAQVANYITLFRDRSFWQTNVHNVQIESLASLQEQRYSTSWLSSIDDVCFKRLASSLFTLSTEPLQVHDIEAENYSVFDSLCPYANTILDNYVTLYNLCNITLRYFTSLERDKRTAEYKRNRKLLKRGYKKLNNKKSLHYA